MIITSTLGTEALLLPLRHFDTCRSPRPTIDCRTHRICQACGQVRIEPTEAASA